MDDDIKTMGKNSEFNLFIDELKNKGYKEADAQYEAVIKFFVVDAAAEFTKGAVNSVVAGGER